MKPVNGIDSEAIKLQAQNLLQNKSKVNLNQEELEVLWQNVKLSGDAALFENIKDEDALAMFDLLDNAHNSAATSYKLFTNWLEAQTGSPIAQADAVKPAPAQAEEVKTAAAQVESGRPAPAQANEVKLAAAQAEDAGVNIDSNIAPFKTLEDAIPVPDTGDTAPVADEAASTAKAVSAGANTEPTSVTLRRPDRFPDMASTVIEIGGKQYSVTNLAERSNTTFTYSMENGVPVFEGHYLSITALDDGDDNIIVRGNNNTIDMGQGNDNIQVEGDSTAIYGGAGNDTIEATGNKNAIYGGDGNDFVKMRGDYNFTNMGNGDDTVWMAGTGNSGYGVDGDDNFFAVGKNNTFMGYGGVDASYYNAEDLEVNEVYEYGVENKIEDASDFERWVKGEEVPEDSPPYSRPPAPLEGHEVQTYGDGSMYRDTFKLHAKDDGSYVSEYRDVAYRELQFKATYDNMSKEYSFAYYDTEGQQNKTIHIYDDNRVVIEEYDKENYRIVTTTIPAENVQYVNEEGTVVNGTENPKDFMDQIARGVLKITGEGEKTLSILTGPCPEPEPEQPPPLYKPITPSEAIEVYPSFNPALSEELTTEFTNLLNDKADSADEATLNAKRSFMNTNVPMIGAAANFYNDSDDKASHASLIDLINKAIDTARAYMQNDDPAKEEELKLAADKASSELREAMG